LISTHSSTERIVVVGAGLAGLRSAQELRRQGFAGGITIVGAEKHLPYDRPPLSKKFLLGEDPDLTLLPAEQEKELNATWLLGRTATHVTQNAVTLDGAETIEADGIVLATGARPRTLPDLPHAHTLRTIEDATALRDNVRNDTRLTIVGAGLIGSEVAAAAATRSAHVTLIEISNDPFGRLFGPAGEKLRRLHQEHGVRLRTGAAVASATADHTDLTDGTRIPTDVLLASVGAVPNDDFAVARQDGVLTDEFGRTSVAGIVAVGDVARYRGLDGQPIRYEHWTNARDMPPTAIAALLADLTGSPLPAPYDPVPYFWSDQYGHHIQVAGAVDGDHAELTGGAESFVIEIQRAGATVGAIGWDSPRMFNRLRKGLRRSA
jgi:NADPH-dependent 2,4-dienoyl-CoA reductase/sulfur reductase-like enzyme